MLTRATDRANNMCGKKGIKKKKKIYKRGSCTAVIQLLKKKGKTLHVHKAVVYLINMHCTVQARAIKVRGSVTGGEPVM